jgi:arylsulfatase
LLFALNSYATVSASAHQIHGTPGAPDATITLDGKQLPPPPFKFGGKIGEVAKDSKPYWPPHIVPPKGAPNVLLIISMDGGWTAG